MTKRIILLSILILMNVVFNTIFCSPVSISDAQKIATRFYLQQKSDVTDATITSTRVFSPGNHDLISVFTFNTGGFVALCLDNSFKPVLAYSLTGNHDLQKFPEAAEKWFSDIADGLNAAINSGKYENVLNEDWLLIDSGEFPLLANKSGLLTTPDWGQGCYYNTMCPVDELGECSHAATGCTATAMAMIMKYWNYPQFGIGSHSYESQWYGTLTANFGETEYLWADMPGVVTEENPAVATLMYHCGVSVDMGYTGTNSGAAISAAAFYNYFGYSHNAVIDYQSNYTWPEWIALLENEIDNGRPVLYAGWESMLIMGHSFVCDGYDALDYLHFNWGGDGYGNGYFLPPDEIAFPANNMIVRNLYPAPDCDVNVSDIIAPYDHTFTGPAAIKVVVENYSNAPLTNIPITYSVNNSTPVTEIITETIEVNGTLEYEFATQFDFSQNPGMLYNVKVYSELACDTYRENDTTVTGILNVSCAAIPYNTDFEPGENTDGWLFDDSNNDGFAWYFSTSGEPCIYYQGGSNAADDWAFSRCLELEAGKLYKLSFDYKSTGMYWPQNLEVSIGSGPESSLMLTSLDELTGFINDSYLGREIIFTVSTTESYYLGFNCFSDPDMLNAVLDNVNITELSQPDIELAEIITPQSSCELGNEIIVVKVRNLCSDILSDIPVSFKLDDGDVVEETIAGEIQPGEYAVFQFETFGDFSAVGTHTLKVYTSMTNDNNLLNDTLELTVENRDASNIPYLCEFETASEYEFYSVENLNEDSHTWQFVSSEGHTNPGCAKYDYADFEAANDWLITKCLYLEQQYAYKLSFWNKIEDASWPENLKVAIGEVQSSAGMLTELGDYPGLSNTLWQENTVNFTVGNNGYYYIGFYCYSAAQMFNLYVDDIEITQDGLNSLESDDTDSFSVFPNPANDMIYIKNENAGSTGSVIGIYDLQGKKIMETTMSGEGISIDIKSLENGIYIVKFESENGLGITKFVKI